MTISVLSNYPSTHSSGGRGAVRCDGDHHLMVWKARRPIVDGAVIPMPWTTFVWRRQRTHSIRRRLAEKDQWRKKRLENGVWRAESRRIEVTACRTKANRFFHVCCKQCNQYSYGQFGTWAVSNANGEDTAGGARDDLAKFFNFQGCHLVDPRSDTYTSRMPWSRRRAADKLLR